MSVRLTNVHKAFGDFHVFKGISLEVPPGVTTAIIGPSGTGKSVLLKHIVGLMQPDQGTVEVFGVDLARASKRELFALRQRIGLCFQDGALFDSLTVGENVGFPLEHHKRDMKRRDRNKRVSEVLERVGLAGMEERLPSQLSGGQRKRVGIARAIVHQPELVLFDEPNSGLDPLTSGQIDDLIREMQAELGVTFLIISHDIVGTVRVAHHIGMLYEGELIAYGPTPEFVRSGHPVVRAFLERNLSLDGDHPTLPIVTG